MEHSTFSAVLGFPPAEQRRLLHDGDPPERLWAAWALALQMGADAIPVVDRALLLDGHDGLRRQLLVLAASFHDRALLATVAAHDPSSDVRGTACAYFLRTAPARTDADTLAFARARLLADDAVVREAILLEHDGDRFVLPRSTLFPLLRDASLSVRALALRCVCDRDGPSEDGMDALMERLPEETDEDLARQMFLAIPRRRYPALFHALRASPASVLVRILLFARERHGTLDWPALTSLSGRTEPAVLIHVLRLLHAPLPDDAFAWVARLYVSLSTHDIESPWLTPIGDARWSCFWLVRADLSPDKVKLLDAGTAAVLRSVFEAEARAIAEYDHEDEDDEDNPAAALPRLEEVLAWFDVHERT